MRLNGITVEAASGVRTHAILELGESHQTVEVTAISAQVATDVIGFSWTNLNGGWGEIRRADGTVIKQ